MNALLRIEQRAASLPSLRWSERVIARLDAYRQTNGDDTFRQRPLPALVDEIGEECDDIAGWVLLALERSQDYDLAPPDRARLVASLEAAAMLGAQAAALVATARRGAETATERQEA